MDWFDLLAVQGTLKSFLQHHISKASILWCSVFFMVQLSHPYMTTGKTITVTISIFVNKMMSLAIEGCFYAETPLFSVATFVDHLTSIVWITCCSFSGSICCCLTLHLSLMEMASFPKLHEPLPASTLPPSALSPPSASQNWGELGPRSRSALGLKECCGWLRLPSRPLRLSLHRQ